MTRIPTKQQVNDTIDYTIQQIKYTNIKELSSINHKEWTEYPQFKIDWDSNPTILVSNKTPTPQDILNYKTFNDKDLVQDAIFCIPKTGIDEGEKRTYYNAYPLRHLEHHIGMLPEYDPKELPPLFELMEYRDVQVIYGPTPEDVGGSLHVSNEMVFMTLGNDRMETYFHELGHLYDKKFTTEYDNIISDEIIAEVTACVLSMIYGKDITESTTSYLSLYVNSDTTLISQLVEKLSNRIKGVLYTIFSDSYKLSKRKIQSAQTL